MLTRRMSLKGKREAVPLQPPLRVLFVALSPEKAKNNDALPEVQYESVMETLRDLPKSREPDNPDPTAIDLQMLAPRHDLRGYEHPEGVVTNTDFDALGDRLEAWFPHVIHIVAHGRHHNDQGRWLSKIAFRHSDGTPQWMGEKDVAGLVAEYKPRLVFLQACESADTGLNPYQAVSGMARALARRDIPAVVAMQFEVEHKMANEFARNFYVRLMRKDPIEVAMHEGVRKLSRKSAGGTSDRRDFGMPVLYLSDDTRLLTPVAPAVRTVPDRRITLGEQSISAAEFTRTVRPGQLDQTEERRTEHPTLTKQPEQVAGHRIGRHTEDNW